MRHTQKCKATLTLVVDGVVTSKTITLYREASGRWFYTVPLGKGKGVTVQYVRGNPQVGFLFEPGTGDPLPR